MTEMRHFRQTVCNNSGETRTRLISCTQVPFDLAPFETRDGWRVIGTIEEFDKIPMSEEVRRRLERTFGEILSRRHKQPIIVTFKGDGEPAKVIATHELVTS